MITNLYSPSDIGFLDEIAENVRPIVGDSLACRSIDTDASAEEIHAQAVTIGAALWRLNKYSTNPDERSKIAEAIAQLARVLFEPPAIHPEAKMVAQHLKAEGLVFLPPFLGPPELEVVRDYFLAHDRTTVEEEALRHFQIEDIVTAPHLLQIAAAPLLLETVSEFLGAPATIMDMSVWQTRPGKEVGAQVFHRDRDDFRSCKLFFYLTDVSDDDGPHVFVVKSHDKAAVQKKFGDYLSAENLDALFSHHGRGVSEAIDALFVGDIKSITGKAGTCFLEMTYGFHRGSVPKKNGQRLLFQVLYGTTPFPKRVKRLKSSKLSGLPENLSSNKAARHALRLFLPA